MEPNYSYAVVNGKLVRKYTLKVEIYPDIEEQVKRILEEIYEQAMTRGMGMRNLDRSEPLYPEPDSSK